MIKTNQRAAFYTLGCKLNFAETSTLARELYKSGFAKVELDQDPDVFLINTCSVTENANRKCRQLVNKARRIAPNAVIADGLVLLRDSFYRIQHFDLAL